MRRLLVALLAVAGLSAIPAVASAHPLGNFTTNHYIGVRVSAQTIDLDVVVDVAEIPSIQLREGLDANADGSLDASETDAARRKLCDGRLAEIDLTVDGIALDLELWAAGLSERAGAGDLPVVRFACEARAPNPSGGTLSLGVTDRGDPDTIGWREIVVRGDGYTTDPGDADLDVADRLTAYPTALLAQPLSERSATVTLIPGGGRSTASAVPDAWPLDGDEAAPAPGPAAAGIPGGVVAELPFLPDFGNLGLGTAIVGILVAAIAGAGHALTPGHGKTVMAAYLVGSRGRARHAVILGATITVSHTLGVIGLAALLAFASDLLPVERVYPVLGTLSGAAVTIIGGWLLIGCLRQLRADRRHAHEHAHGHAHDHEHSNAAARVPGIGGILAIGIAGGLVPSTAALVLLLAAVAAGQPAYGLALALAFGAGMAAVLTGIGLAIVHGRDRVGQRLAGIAGRLPVASRLARATPWAIALVVLVGGVLLAGQALSQTL